MMILHTYYKNFQIHTERGFLEKKIHTHKKTTYFATLCIKILRGILFSTVKAEPYISS